MSPSRQRQRLRVSVALVCVATLLLASCHGSARSTRARAVAVPSTDAKGKPRLARVRARPAHGPGRRARPSRSSRTIAKQHPRKLVNKYIATGITKPLFTGIAGDRARRRTSRRSLASRVGPKGHDRAALTRRERAGDDRPSPASSKQPLNARRARRQRPARDGRRAVRSSRSRERPRRDRSRSAGSETSCSSRTPATQWHITGYDIVVRRDDTSDVDHAARPRPRRRHHDLRRRRRRETATRHWAVRVLRAASRSASPSSCSRSPAWSPRGCTACASRSRRARRSSRCRSSRRRTTRASPPARSSSSSSAATCAPASAARAATRCTCSPSTRMLHKGTLLNIPRDTCASIPGNGTGKINAANAYGGPTLHGPDDRQPARDPPHLLGARRLRRVRHARQRAWAA